MKKAALVLALIVGLAYCFQCRAQTGIDRDLLNEIYKIKAIDNHAHPLKYVEEGEKPDDEFDALPLDAIVPFPLPVRLNFFFSSRRRHTRSDRDWSSDVCSSD